MSNLAERAAARVEDVLPSDHVFAGLRRNAYGVILADPPWHFKVRSAKGQGRSPERHYRTMTINQVAALPVRDLATRDCHLFMWITGPWLAAGAHLQVLKGWGFEPSAMAFVWLKTNDPDTVAKAETWEEVFFQGPGFTTRQNAEYVILARRGSPKRVSTLVRQPIISRRREHSRKPDAAIRRIEEYTGQKGVELFARASAPGWDVWGDEVGKFDETE
jgi:N6-adenosine-specific RNA methylase IME4